jgi:hypothetical protein
MELILAVIASLALLGFAALQWGADSRTSNVDARYPTNIGRI